MERRLAAILAADVVGYTRLMAKDETGTLLRLKDLLKDVVRPRILGRKGRIVKLMGDGLLAEFPSVVEAVLCAIDMQQQIAAGVPDAAAGPIRLRIGVNLGDIIIDGSDIYGQGVNVAARLKGLAEPGGICLSEDAYRQVAGKLGVPCEDLGERSVKNIAEPLRVYRIALAESAAATDLPPSPPAATRALPSIAVLPFTNMSGDAEQDYFADGITEDIITDLSKLSNLRVAARNSSFVFRNAPMNIRQIAAELQVRYVVEGSVRKSGDNIRITAQLIDGLSDAHLWAERYDRRLSNIFELQDEIATSIVKALKLKISPRDAQALDRPATHDVVAYENCLRARGLLREMTRRSVELARQMFKRAIALDADYALAHCGVANCDTTLTFHYNVDETYLEEALDSSRRALELDPELPEARAAYGRALDRKGDFDAAERAYLAAIALHPKAFEALESLGSLYLLRGRAEEAQAYYKKACELADYDLQALMMLSNAYRAAGNRQDLEATARQALAISEKRLQINPEDERAAYVGAMALVDLGHLDRARQWAELASATVVEDSRASYNLACLYGLLGDVEASLADLEKTLAMGCSKQKQDWMRVDGDLAQVRADPRFEALVGRYA